MNVVLQKDLFLRSNEVFLRASVEHDINFILTDVLDESVMIEHHAEGVNCFVIGAEAYSLHFYETLRQGSAIIRYGVGYNAVPIDVCMEREIKVGYTPGTLTDSVAEYTFALMMALNKHIAPLHSAMKQGVWYGMTGWELKGKTIAILGFGQIGREVARIAKYGFGMRVHAFDVHVSVDSDLCDFYSNDFATVVRDADIVSIHMASVPATKNFISAERIRQCKEGVQFINTSRGDLVDEKSLYNSLKSKKISSAAIDVFVNEPYVPSEGADFRDLDNVLLTPHCGSNTKEASKRMAELVVQNILAYRAGERMILIPELQK
ncbi:MAG: NAD(P)-dependent oxidoreductase [Paludibacter sp.]|nr:NAD(P)-dependent oxidoreductase [Paludibacter sp.]